MCFCVTVCFGGGVYRSKAVGKQVELGGNAEGGDQKMQIGSCSLRHVLHVRLLKINLLHLYNAV